VGSSVLEQTNTVHNLVSTTFVQGKTQLSGGMHVAVCLRIAAPSACDRSHQVHLSLILSLLPTLAVAIAKQREGSYALPLTP